ncbi:hypothetical protein Leryth_023621 [Lithospermum erythrorhizon]|nr:hypothetical protein Leryth_023621 [Lithospermum erythrorhizon]
MMLKFQTHTISFLSSSSFPECCPLPKQVSITNITRPDSSYLSNSVISLGIALSISLVSTPLPSLAIPSLNNFTQSSSSSLLPTTPFSQSKNLPTGLDKNGKIRACPSINPSCITTNPQSTSFTFPWKIPNESLRIEDAFKQLQDAILETQTNVKIQVVEDTPNGKFVQAEVDGGSFGRDVMEFLVKDDHVVAYRAMATKVNYVYPFTTAFGDSKGQEERMKKIKDQLGWYAPSIDAME